MTEILTDSTFSSARLAGRVALVTGSSRGVGRGIALRLAAEGAAVAVNYRTGSAAADEVVDEIVCAGGTAAAYGASISDDIAVADMCTEIAAELGVVDLLVSNAGTASRGKTVLSTQMPEFQSLFDVHVLGPIDLIRRLLPGMRAAERGDIIVVSSAFTDAAPARCAPYTMAKAAIEAAARTIAKEERLHGIRVNIVAPGLVATDMGERLVSAGGDTLENLADTYPFGRVCVPADVAAAVAYLASGDGSYVTGQRLLIDGGGPEQSML
ncbi:oxidoreductase [Rhodococcus sp. 14-2483-1-2]|nr:SDR family oxidoreductase [Rhodococcus sp. 14-2483-1-2]OZF39622.1 oxidoreductase [Rhodococcus sp. 14-2483-1-2]